MVPGGSWSPRTSPHPALPIKRCPAGFLTHKGWGVAQGHTKHSPPFHDPKVTLCFRAKKYHVPSKRCSCRHHILLLWARKVLDLAGAASSQAKYAHPGGRSTPGQHRPLLHLPCSFT